MYSFGAAGNQATGSIVAVISSFPPMGVLLKVNNAGDGSLGSEALACVVVESDNFASTSMDISVYPISGSAADHMLPEHIATCDFMLANQPADQSVAEAKVEFALADDTTCPDTTGVQWNSGAMIRGVDFEGELFVDTEGRTCFEGSRAQLRDSNGAEDVMNVTSAMLPNSNMSLISYQHARYGWMCTVLDGSNTTGTMYNVMPIRPVQDPQGDM